MSRKLAGEDVEPNSPLPQTVEPVTLTSTSVGSTMRGLATSSMRTSFLPCQTRACIRESEEQGRGVKSGQSAFREE